MSESELSSGGPPQGEEAVSSGVTIPAVEVAEQLQRILRSGVFRNAPRHSRFLDFTVKKTLSGEEQEVKEYLIGLEVLPPPADSHPRSDSIVRAEARRLRSRLADYYRTEGESDLIQIDLPKGTYVPVFQRRNGNGASSSAAATSSGSVEPEIGARTGQEALVDPADRG